MNRKQRSDRKFASMKKVGDILLEESLKLILECLREEAFWNEDELQLLLVGTPRNSPEPQGSYEDIEFDALW